MDTMIKDARSVENPISAMFDLSDDVNKQAVEMKKMVKYATIFISFGLFVNFLLILSTITNIIVMPILVALFIIGSLALRMIRRTGRFFDYYLLRHRAIVAVRDADPVVYIPKGETSTQRLMSYLNYSDPELRQVLASPGVVVKQQAILKGAKGTFYNFDQYVVRKPRFMGLPGYALYVKAFESPPTLKDLQAIGAGVQDITNDSKVLPRRIIALWTRTEDDNLDDDAYEFLTCSVMQGQLGRDTYTCAMQVVVENPDGTYDFIPWVVSPGG